MGTSMMLAIQQENELKIANYYNWDGSPLSSGINIFKSLKLSNIDELKMGVSKTLFFNEYETKIYLDALRKPPSQINVDIPNSIMQTSDGLIEYLCETDEKKIRLINDIESLDACNYVYFINFDNSSYEMYENHFSEYSCQKCLEICNIRYKRFERLEKFDIYNLPTLKEYKACFN